MISTTRSGFSMCFSQRRPSIQCHRFAKLKIVRRRLEGVNITQRRAATSPTSTGADAINGRSTTTKVTTTRSTSRPTHKGNLEIRTSLESSTINNLYAVMEEQSPDAAARRRSLQIAKQTATTKDFQEPSSYTSSTATSTSLSTSEVVQWIVKM
ncbi:unnamed protein product [Caenorhabditis nigoni]